MDAYTKSLEDMLMYTFDRINKSKNPEENMKWFVSKEAREWYDAYKEIINSVESVPVVPEVVTDVVTDVAPLDTVIMKEDIENTEIESSKGWIDKVFK